MKKTFQLGVSFLNTALASVKNWLGLRAAGGIFTGTAWHNIPQFASGGTIADSGRTSWWDTIQKYAAGTAKIAHGTLFAAGEAGPEVVGHINGRTEVLNRSQIASAIYSGVLAGMEVAVNSLGRYLYQRMGECTNAVVSSVSAAGSVISPVPVRVAGADTALIDSISALSNRVQYVSPAITSGTVMPYEIVAEMRRSTDRLIAALERIAEEIIQANIAATGSQTMTLASAFEAALREYAGRNPEFDGTALTSFVINEINRRTNMFSKSPLIG